MNLEKQQKWNQYLVASVSAKKEIQVFLRIISICFFKKNPSKIVSTLPLIPEQQQQK